MTCPVALPRYLDPVRSWRALLDHAYACHTCRAGGEENPAGCETAQELHAVVRASRRAGYGVSYPANPTLAGRPPGR